MRDCPECEAPLREGARKCRACGWTPAPEQRKDEDRADPRCIWIGRHGRCSMGASWFPSGPKSGTCSWHGNVQRDPVTDTLEEFERWCGYLRSRRYCTVWTHAEPVHLWARVNGQSRSLTYGPCERPGCPYCAIGHSGKPATVGGLVANVTTALTEDVRDDHEAKKRAALAAYRANAEDDDDVPF